MLKMKTKIESFYLLIVPLLNKLTACAGGGTMII